jgi:nucleoside-diphosphate-sugar epimerase
LRIFVIGATGVIGRRLVPLLLARGHSVTIAARPGHAHSHAAQAGVTPVAADLFDRDTLRRAVEGHDAVINLATHMPSSAWKMVFRSAWRVNDRLRSEGVTNLVEAARSQGITKFVQESFALAYPDRGDDWIDEDTALEPADYNRTVLDAERAVAEFSSRGGTGIVLRFAAFYGPDAMQVQSYISSLRRGWAALPGGPHRFISSISHDDAAAAVAAVLDAPKGVYTVTDDEPVRRREFFGSLAANLRLKPPRFLPLWTAPLFGSVGDAMARSLRLSNRKLKAQTRWTPRYPSVRDGWPAILREMASNGAAT